MGDSPQSVDPRQALFAALLAEAGVDPAAAGPELRRRERHGTLPLSRAQELLWWIHHAAPETTAYTLRWVTRIKGSIDLPALLDAMRRVSLRHDILRATFPQVDGEPVTCVADDPMACALVDLRDRTRAEAERLVGEEVRTAGTMPWVLAVDRPTATVYRVDDDECVLVVRLHHMYSDGWSQGVFFNDLAAAYACVVEGRDAPPGPALQYVDWVLWDRDREATPAYERSLAYWRDRLRGAPATIDLPTDRPRTGAVEQAGARETLVLSAEVVKRLRGLNRECGCTMYMTLLAAFKTLLLRYTGQEDLAILSPIANREHTALASLIGYFANSVVIRTALAAADPFTTVLSRVRAATLEAQEHQGVAYARVLDELPRASAGSVTPFSQVMFAMQNVPRSARSLPSAVLTAEPVDDASVKFDLMLSCTEIGDTIRVAALYRPALFDGATVRALLGHFKRILAAAIATPDIAVGAIPLLDGQEADELSRWGRGPTSAPTSRTLVEMLRLQATRTPDAAAVAAGGESLSYRELQARARAVALRLAAAGVRRGARVGVCADRSPEMMIALLGVLEAGAAYVPLDPEYPASRIAYMLADSGARVVLVTDRTRGALPPFDGDVLSIDGTAVTECVTPDEPSGSDLAYVIYTSGSTGAPKGVMVEHRSVVNYLEWMRARYPLGAGDAVLQKAPISFDASVWELFLPLVTGARLVVARPRGHQDAEYLARLVEEERVSVVQFVPSQVRMLLELPSLSTRLRSVRRVFLGGEAAPADVVNALASAMPDATITNLYGPTEATVYCTAWDLPRGERVDVVPIGAPIANTEVRVLSPAGALQPVGVPGDLVVSGAGVARGYHDRPDLTAAAFIADGHDRQRAYRTGDVARWRRDGVLEYLGRRDHQVKLRGFRIELAEIERALSEHAAVRATAVIVRDDIDGDPRLIAYVVPTADGVSPAALRAHLRTTLPEYMVPTAFVEMPALPLSASGKLDRRALPAPTTDVSEFVAPATTEEDVVASVWREVLRVDRVGARDNFFELGGHSLLAMRALGRIEHATGVRVSFADFAASPTVADVARRIATAARAQRAALEAPRERAGLPLSFQQELMWALESADAGHVAYNVSELARVSGALDIDALQRALDAVVARHEALRSRVDATGARITITIDAPLPARLDVVDLAGAGRPGDRERAARRVIAERARLPFDLTRDQLLRALVVTLSPDDHLLLVDLHHFAADGWSKGIVIRELSSAYEQATRGGVPDLGAPPVQYAAYACRQRERDASGDLAEQLEFWRAALEDAPRVVDLPTDRLRAGAPSFAGGRRTLSVPAALRDRLSATAAAHDATLFAGALAAVASVLYRYSGQGDIVVGVPVAGRDDPSLESSVGFFASALPLRLRVDGDVGFGDVVREARRVSVEALDHPEVPVERIAESLGDAGSALFNVLFAFQSESVPSLSLGSARVVRETLGRGTAKVDLAFFVTDAGGDGLRLAIEYRSGLFDDATIDRFLRHLHAFIAAATANPPTPVAEIPLADADERRLVLEEWNRTATVYPRDRRVDERFHEIAASAPDATALVDDGDEVTYRTLAERAARLARTLREVGLAPGAFVALCAERSPALVAAMIATLECDCAYVPLDMAFPPARLAFMLSDTHAPVVIVEDDLAPAIAPTLAALDSAPVVIHVSRAGAVTAVAGGAAPRHDLLDGRHAASRGVAPSTSAAYVMYTSGSTGQPKGVVVPHRGIVRLVCSTDYCRFGADDAVLAMAPTAFDASTLEIWGALLTGGRVVLLRDGFTDPAALADVVDAHGVTAMWLTAALFQQVADSPELERLTSLRYLLAGGDVLSVAHVRRVLDALPTCTLINGYGPTENTTFTCCQVIDRGWPEDRAVPIGRPIANTRVYVLDVRGTAAPIGVPGELYAAGDGVALGYLNHPELTSERFVADPFAREPGGRMYRTGDRARWREDGTIEFLGRLDAQVKIRGFRVEPAEIDAVLGSHAAVRAAVVVPRPAGADGALELVAYYVPEGDQVRPAVLRAYLRERLPEHMVPAALVAIDALPVGPTGKVDRRALAAPPAADADTTEFVAPRGDTELALARIWCDVLHVDAVSTAASFFEMGGHSLLAMRMLGVVRGRFAVRVPLREFFARPTVRELARVVDAGGARADVASSEPVRDAAGAEAPLTPAQELLWLLERASPGAAAYHVHEAVRVHGELDEAALELAVRALVRRHDALRAVVVDDARRLRQRVLSDVDVPLVRYAASGEEDAERVVADFVRAPFDLTRGPLVRACLVRIADGEAIVALALHHIVTDGWSQGIVRRELSALYAAARRGATPALPPVRASYSETMRAVHDRSTGDALVDFWRSELDGDLRPLQLPGAEPGRASLSFDGGSIVGTIPADLVARIDAVARDRGVTRFMVLLAALQVVLHRYTGESDVLVGAPVAGRDDPAVAGLVGYLANTVVLRGRVGDDPSFAQLLARTRETCLGAYEHQDIPFERLAAAIGRDTATAPLVQVLLAVQNMERTELCFEGAETHAIRASVGAAKFDVTMSVAEHGGALAVTLVHRRAAMSHAAAKRMLGHFATVLEAVSAEPDVRISRVPLLTADEHARHAAWNATQRPGGERTIDVLLTEQAARSPNAIAVEEAGRALTFAELDRDATRIARLVQSHGVGRDARVGIFLERSIEMVVAIAGVLKAGAAYVPLDPEYPVERLQAMAEDAGLSLVLTAPALRGRLGPLDVPEICPGEDAASPPARDPHEIARFATPESLAYVIFTSGSTGRPKGVMIPHRAVVNFVTWARERFALTPDDAVLLKAPVSFDASVLELFLPLVSGARLVLAPRDAHRDPDILLATVKRFGVSMIQFVPSLLSAIVDLPAFAEQLDGVRAIVCGGEALPTALAERVARLLPASRIVNLYGPTETTVYSAIQQWPAEGAVAGETVAIGRPIANTVIHVLDASGALVPRGVRGEIHIGGSGVARGYIGRPELTAERFVADATPGSGRQRLYRTGDLGVIDDAGVLHYLGRSDHQVKLRGFRVELAEIEAALVQTGEVVHAAAVVRDIGGVQRLLACYTPRAGSSVTPPALLARLRRRLPAYMVPEALTSLAEMPLSPTGKVDRHALPEIIISVPERVPSAPPVLPIERTIAGIWETLLRSGCPALDDDFFVCGGNSLLAIRLVSRVREATGVALSIRAVFEAPTLRSMAERVTDALVGSADDAMMRDLLGELSALSDDDAERLLKEENLQ